MKTAPLICIDRHRLTIDGEEVKRDEQPQQSQRVENPAQSSGSKESMVAEPIYMYASRRTFTGLR